MIMLSQLNQFHVVDETGKSAKLVDLALALLEEDYPPVTQLFVEQEKKIYRLDWEAVQFYDARKRRLMVKNLSEAVESPYESINGDVLVNHDILDALVIDLQNRSTTRANDLQFDDSEDIYRLRAVDTGWGAILRRITKGRYRHVSDTALYDWKYVEFLRGDPKAVKNGAGYRMRIGRLPAGEIAQLADYIPYLHAAELIMLLPDPIAADVLEAMTLERQLQVFEELDPKVGLELLTRMESDHAADLLGRLKVTDMKRFLKLLPKGQCERILQLLRYPEDTVGGVMVNNILTFTPEQSLANVREEFHRRMNELDLVTVFFVIEDETTRKLLGVVSLQELLTSSNGKKGVKEIMNPFLETLRPFESAREAAYRIVSGQLAAMPVTDSNGKLLGAMTFVAAVPQLAPETSMLRTVRVFS